MWYLDDATLQVSPERVHDYLVVLLKRLIAIALEVNGRKCELSFSMTACRRSCSESAFRGLRWLKRVTFHCWEPRWICKAFCELYVKRGKLLREWRQSWRWWIHIKHLYYWRMPLQYQNCNNLLRGSPDYMCREELRIFYRALFDSLGIVANVSLEGDAWKQAGFPVSFGGLGCRRAGDIALPSFLASMNSVSELVETILSWTNISDSNEHAEAVDSWIGLVVVLPCPMTRGVRRPGTFLLQRVIVIVSGARKIMCLEPYYWTRHWKRVGLGSMLCRFRSLGQYWTLRALGLPLPSEGALMFLFPIFVAAAGGWTVGVCMACPANTVLVALKGTRQ